MANFNKKWGTVIACWAVALVMIITGVCLGLTIPSSAAGEPVAVVTCGDTVEYFTDFSEVNEYVNYLPTTTEQPAVVKLLKNIYADKTVGLGAVYQGDGFRPNYVVLDLAGHILQSNDQIVLACAIGGSLTVMDSNPTVTRYAVRHRDSDGTISYEFFDNHNLPAGTAAADAIHGGIVTGKNVEINSFYGGHNLIINGGNFLGTGCINASGFGTDGEITEEDMLKNFGIVGFIPSRSVIINGGLMQLYSNFDGADGNYSIAMYYDGNLEINGGTIWGKVAYVGNDEKIVDIDLTAPKTDAVKINKNIIMKPQYDDDNNFLCYQAVDATTGEPIPPEKPDVPAATEQPTSNNNSLVGLIILGAAAAVMVVGVTVIIIVNAKRRKKVA